VAFAEGLSRLPDIDQVLVIPVAQNPLKATGLLLPNALRWQMTRAAMAKISKAVVLDLEMRREPPSYSVVTLQTLQTLYPDCQFDFALGWDAFCDLARWREGGRILEQAGVIVVPRADVGAPSSAPPEGILGYLPEGWASRLHVRNPGEWADQDGRRVLRYVPMKLPDVSGSQVLADRQWDRVPLEARDLLLQYLGIAVPST
jgi:nicotinic acid mononucleotide adenylyltransferase